MSWEENLKRFDQAAKIAQIERKGKTMPYTSANGHMFALLNKDGELGIRLSTKDQQEFDKKFGLHPFRSHGAVMRDYVLIPQEILFDLNALAKYLKKGHDYAKSLQPK